MAEQGGVPPASQEWEHGTEYSRWYDPHLRMEIQTFSRTTPVTPGLNTLWHSPTEIADFVLEGQKSVEQFIPSDSEMFLVLAQPQQDFKDGVDIVRFTKKSSQTARYNPGTQQHKIDDPENVRTALYSTQSGAQATVFVLAHTHQTYQDRLHNAIEAARTGVSIQHKNLFDVAYPIFAQMTAIEKANRKMGIAQRLKGWLTGAQIEP